MPQAPSPLTVSLAAQQSPKPAGREAGGVARAGGDDDARAEQTALVKHYCATCHTDRGKERTAACRSQSFDAAKLEENGEVTEKMIRKLRAGMMPPPGAKRPEPAVITGAWRRRSSRGWTSVRRSIPIPGSRPFQRLNRAEYRTRSAIC